MSGFIYCITCPIYEIDDIYKLGYTAKVATIEEVKSSLLIRYGTTLISPNCVSIFPVYQPNKAEKELFMMLKDYNIQNELFKADYNTIIDPALQKIRSKYQEDKSNDLIKKYVYRNHMNIAKKMVKNTDFKDELMKSLNTMNAENQQTCCDLYNKINYIQYGCTDVGDVSCVIQGLDYNDSALLELLYDYKIISKSLR
jgi:hypothetical protein